MKNTKNEFKKYLYKYLNGEPFPTHNHSNKGGNTGQKNIGEVVSNTT